MNHNKVNKKTTEMLKIKSEPIGKIDESSDDEPEERSRSRQKQKSKPIRKNMSTARSLTNAVILGTLTINLCAKQRTRNTQGAVK